MLNDKMNALIDEVCGELAEREELVHTIALALLTGKNLFVLPGDARHLPGAVRKPRQFEGTPLYGAGVQAIPPGGVPRN